MAPQDHQSLSSTTTSGSSLYNLKSLLTLSIAVLLSSYLTTLFLTPHYPTSNTPAMAPSVSASTFLEAFSHRRSVYTINDKSPISDARIEEIVQQVVSQAPSAYNTQTSRFVVLLGDKSKEFWAKTAEIAKNVIVSAKGEEGWKQLEGRFGIFGGAYGSILFFESGESLKKAQETFKDAAHAFPQWTEHASAMAQVILWTSLELEGFGANLQHLNALPGVTESARKAYGLPEGWDLKAQLVFGGLSADMPAKKEKLPFSETIKIVK